MAGIIFSILAGMAMSLQGVFNTRLSEKVGLYESNLLVQGMAFLLSCVAFLILGKGSFAALRESNRVYLLGGVLGILITLFVMLGIGNLSPTVSISLILVSQLLVAAIIDAFGWFGTEKAPFRLPQYIGLALMIGGILVFKLRMKQ